MLKAVDATEMTPTVPLQFVKMAPVGKSRTAGYCLQGFAEVHRLLLENKPRQARLHVLRMMSSLEQFLIDESWTVRKQVDLHGRTTLGTLGDPKTWVPFGASLCTTAFRNQHGWLP